VAGLVATALLILPLYWKLALPPRIRERISRPVTRAAARLGHVMQ
jgi:hypothetical protein